MQALGLIETIGLVAAIVSADTMLKAAEVTLIDKTYVGGGLVSIAVTGGVAAVKSAVEAGAAAVKQINGSSLVSQHVIPRPHEEVDDLLLSKKPVKNGGNTSTKSSGVQSSEPTEIKARDQVERDSQRQDETNSEESGGIKPIEEAAEKDIEDLAESNTVVEEPEVEEPIVEQLVPEVLVVEEPLAEGPVSEIPEANKQEPENIDKAFVDRIALENGAEKAIEFLSTLKVTKLRSLAREYSLGIAGRMISRADGKTLISEFKKYYK